MAEGEKPSAFSEVSSFGSCAASGSSQEGQLEAPLWLSAAAALLYSDTGGTDKGWSKAEGRAVG
jgi:hypothetical protein